MIKYVFPVLIFLFLVLAVFMNLSVWWSEMFPFASPFMRGVVTILLLGVLVILIIVFIQRIREIKKEEKDDLSQY